jgi:hypothetical protein
MKKHLTTTREGALRYNLNVELTNKSPNLEKIISYINEYEKNNLATIDKLKRGKTIDTKRINGALKCTIKAHGPITMVLIGSASKRIYGSLLNNHSETEIINENIFKKILKWIRKK